MKAQSELMGERKRQKQLPPVFGKMSKLAVDTSARTKLSSSIAEHIPSTISTLAPMANFDNEVRHCPVALLSTTQ